MKCTPSYQSALATGTRKGYACANDIEVLAGLCHTAALLGAYSPKLLFDGAIKKGLSSREFAAVIATHDPIALDDLQWA